MIRLRCSYSVIASRLFMRTIIFLIALCSSLTANAQLSLNFLDWEIREWRQDEFIDSIIIVQAEFVFHDESVNVGTYYYVGEIIDLNETIEQLFLLTKKGILPKKIIVEIKDPFLILHEYIQFINISNIFL